MCKTIFILTLCHQFCAHVCLKKIASDPPVSSLRWLWLQEDGKLLEVPRGRQWWHLPPERQQHQQQQQRGAARAAAQLHSGINIILKPGAPQNQCIVQWIRMISNYGLKNRCLSRKYLKKTHMFPFKEILSPGEPRPARPALLPLPQCVQTRQSAHRGGAGEG